MLRPASADGGASLRHSERLTMACSGWRRFGRAASGRSGPLRVGRCRPAEPGLKVAAAAAWVLSVDFSLGNRSPRLALDLLP